MPRPYFSGSLSERFLIDPDFKRAEELVRSLEREYDQSKQRIKELEIKVMDIEALESRHCGSVAGSKRARFELDTERENFARIDERRKEATRERDLLIAKPHQAEK